MEQAGVDATGKDVDSVCSSGEVMNHVSCGLWLCFRWVGCL